MSDLNTIGAPAHTRGFGNLSSYQETNKREQVPLCQDKPSPTRP